MTEVHPGVVVLKHPCLGLVVSLNSVGHPCLGLVISRLATLPPQVETDSSSELK